MAEGLNVSRGINQGAAQIYNSTQNAVNTYARTVAQQQAKREAEQKALADKLSQFNTEGLREVDKDGFYQVYDGWKNKTYEAMKAKDPKERFRLQAEAEKERQKAQKYVFDSKAKTQRDLAVGTKVLGKPHFFSEQGKQLYNKSLSAPIYSKDDIVDYSTIPLGYDKSKVVSEINKLNEELLKFGKYDEVEGVTKKAGDLTVAEFAKIKRVPQEAQLRAYEMLYRGNDGFKAMLEESYPQLDWDNNEGQAMQMALTDMVTNAPLVKDEGVERRSVPKPDNWQEKALFYDMLRDGNREAGQGGEGSGESISMDIPFAKGTGSFTAEEYVPISLPKKNFAGSSFIDLKTGKPSTEKLPSSGDYEIVGVTNVPIINDRIKDKSLVGAVSQPKFARENPQSVVRKPMIHVQLPITGGGKRDYLIPYDRLPENVKSSKAVREALAKFRPATPTSQPQKTTQPTSGKKTIKGF